MRLTQQAPDQIAKKEGCIPSYFKNAHFPGFIHPTKQ